MRSVSSAVDTWFTCWTTTWSGPRFEECPLNGTVHVTETVVMDDRPVPASEARGVGTIATAVASSTSVGAGRIAGDPTDHLLVAAVRSGDDTAFEKLYERYHRRIASYIYGMVHDYGRAEDIAQDVFM